MAARMIALALLLAATGAAAAPPADAQAVLERAGRLSEMADNFAGAGDRGAAISTNRKALKLIDEALAAGADPAKVEPGKRMIQLDTADWLVTEQKYDDALTLFRDAAGAKPGSLADYLRTRALKGIVAAEAGAGHADAARAALADLVANGRAMLARDPHNIFLTRQLGEFLEVDTLVRYWTGNDEPEMRATALETLDLFRRVAEANPTSGEARRAQFLWAWRNARIINDIALWKEALAAGDWLRVQGELKRYGPVLDEVKRKVDKYDRTGVLTIGD